MRVHQHTVLAMLAGDAAVGLWNLIQMPHPGSADHSGLHPERAAHLLRSDCRERSARDPGAIRWRMAAQGQQKIGVRATATTGRVGYRYAVDGAVTLIVRKLRG